MYSLMTWLHEYQLVIDNTGSAIFRTSLNRDLVTQKTF